jgi:hypothetical protein
LQEIDYIMPVSIQFAVFAGLCFGGTSYLEKQFQVSSDSTIEKSVINKTAWSLVGLSLFTIIGGVYYANSISWGGYGFDPTSNSFSRWFRPEGVIAATSDGRDKDYSIYWGDLDLLKLENFSDFKVSNPDILIQGDTLFLKNGSKLNPHQYSYRIQKKKILPQRLVSFSLNQPPGQTNVIMAAQKGMSSWELEYRTKGITVGRWCDQSCNFLLYRPVGKNKQHDVILQMPLPGINEKNPVHLIVRSQPLIGETTFPDIKRSKQLLNTPFPKNSLSSDLIFRHPDNMFPLTVDFQTDRLWLISLKTDRTIIPKEYDSNSTDDRKLGVKVLF